MTSLWSLDTSIAVAYPSEHESPVPKQPDPARVSPQCFLLLSTPQVLAFLDILPISEGHILLIPRHHWEKLSDMTPLAPDAAAKALWRRSFEPEGSSPAQALGFWMPLLSRALSRALDFEDWNVVQNNGARAAQVVGHVHFHFIPRYSEERRASKGKGKIDVGQLSSWKVFGRGQREELDDDEGLETARKIREHLQREVDRLPPPRARTKL